MWTQCFIVSNDILYVINLYKTGMRYIGLAFNPKNKQI